MSLLLWAAAVLALLGVLILVHELGHFVFARLFDVKVLRFSLGFGPRLLGLTLSETEYRLSLIPLGGYVRLLGEDPTEAIPPIDRQRALAAKPLWQRYTIVMAGPVFNLLLPLLIYFVHYAGQRTLLPPTIGSVLPDLPAARAGLLSGDKVESVDGKKVRYWEELERTIAEGTGRTMRFVIRRGSEAEERDVTPVGIERVGTLRMKENVGWIGVSPRFHLPEIGVLDPNSPAAQAGLKSFDFVTSVNGAPVATWAEFTRAVERTGASPLRLTYLRGGYSAVPFAHIEVQQPSSAVVIPVAVFDGAGHRRYETGILSAELFVFSVEPGSPADQIGVRRGDQILELDGQAIPHWDLLRQRLASNPTRTFQIAWVSPGGVRHDASFKQEVRSELDAYRQEEEHLIFGALNRLAWKTEAPVPISNRFGYAVSHSVERTGQIIVAMTHGFVELLRGRVPLSTLGGPIMIGYVAGVAAEQGFDQYLWLMALISINLGLLNFLPVPILDGGMLVFFTLELFKRRPPSVRAREIASYVGLVVVATLMLFALRNDVVRYLLPR
ncbi:MAG: regulator of sigma protease [Myxococcales bacterium]|jgi:regulator of sigma E protease|nr:regulator of sigma protease [Myxococcales bacterium]